VTLAPLPLPHPESPPLVSAPPCHVHRSRRELESTFQGGEDQVQRLFDAPPPFAPRGNSRQTSRLGTVLESSAHHYRWGCPRSGSIGDPAGPSTCRGGRGACEYARWFRMGISIGTTCSPAMVRAGPELPPLGELARGIGRGQILTSQSWYRRGEAVAKRQHGALLGWYWPTVSVSQGRSYIGRRVLFRQ
jgi:hypothetical protein